MKRKLQTWLAGLGSAFPTAFSPYGRALPMTRMKLLLAGTFFVTSATGFAFDLMQLNASRVGQGFFWPILAGGAGTAVLALAIKKVRLIPLLYLLLATIGWLGYRASHVSAPLPVPHALQRRGPFDAVAVLVWIVLGPPMLGAFSAAKGLAGVAPH